MPRVRVHNFSISLDGYGAGSRQTREEPLGVGGEELHVAIAPRLLGSGEHLLHGLDLKARGYDCTTHVSTAAATHFVLTKGQ